MESHPDNATTFRPRHISLLACKLDFSLVKTLVSPAFILSLFFFIGKVGWSILYLFLAWGVWICSFPFSLKKFIMSNFSISSLNTYSLFAVWMSFCYLIFFK